MLSIDMSKVEVRTNTQGYLLWKIQREDLESFGFTEAILSRCQTGSGHKLYVTVFAHKAMACHKIGKPTPEDCIIRFDDGDKNNVTPENLRIFVVRELLKGVDY